MTNLQLVAIDDIREQLGPARGPEILLTFGERAEGPGMAPFTEVLRYYPDARSGWTKLRHLSVTRAALRRTIALCQAADAVDVFYAHENHVVPNYLVHQLRRHLRPGAALNYHVVPEGTLNVASWRAGPGLALRGVAKSIAMRLAGLAFRVPRGEILADHLAHVTSYFSYAPAMTMAPASLVVPLRHRRSIDHDLDDGVCLVLGQPLEYSVSRALARDLALGLRQHLLNDRAYRVILYRPHQFPAVMDEVFADARHFTPAPSGGTVEELLAAGTVRPRDVYSFSSSALQNLPMFFPGTFRTYAYGLDALMGYNRINHRMHDDIRKAFEAYGVIMVPHRLAGAATV